MGPGTDEIDRLAEAAALVSKKWHLPILRVLAADGPAGFNDLKEQLGSVSAKVLSDSLEDLQEADLVDRRVISESPLRVEYELTGAGEDMRPVVEAFLGWADEHLGTGRPTVLVADDDPRVADLHADWLAVEYDVVTAYDADGAVETAADADVAVMDRGMDGTDADKRLFGEVAEATEAGVVALSSSDPGLDVVDLPIEAYLVKPIEESRLVDTVAAVLDRVGYDAAEQEYLRLCTRRGAVRSATSERRRADSDAYERLERRIEQLEGRIDDDRLPELEALTGGTPARPG